MKILIVGSGGIGGYFGARLAAGGSDVTFVARGAHLQAMRRGGLHVRSPLGDLHLRQIKTIETVSEASDVELVIVAVKLWDTEEVAASLAPLANKGAVVVSFQNGVQKDEVLGGYIRPSAILGGVSYIAAVIESPGVIAHSGAMQKLIFGGNGAEASVRAARFFEECRKAGIDAEINFAIERLIWEKFVFLVGLSGTTAKYRSPIGPIRENPAKRRALHRAMQEVVSVGRAKGIPLSADFADNRLAFCDSIPATMTSSMEGDLARGKRLELPWLSGAVVSIGEKLGVPTPVNADIVRQLEPAVMGRNVT